MTNEARIFVRIAAYREFDLVPTLRDMIAMATNPDRLRICICWQRDADESLAEFAGDARLDVIDVPHLESEGMCWARNLIQQRWDGEEYTLGIDGHHRFVPNWDRTLVELTRGLRDDGHDRPIVGGYAPSFEPRNDPRGRRRDVWLTNFDRFDDRGILFMRPTAPAQTPTGPVPCRFWSGHFNFTLGEWNAEVLTDPDAYFHSEEIVMTVRSWTHGFDLFTPHMTVLWHEYSRANRVCHWDDHSDWDQRSARAVAQYRALFGMDPDPIASDYEFGFGSVRTLQEYERFAGVDFERQAVQRHTADNGLPPNPGVESGEWEDSLLRSFERTVSVERRLFDQDCDFWALIVNAEDGTELYRHDHNEHEVQAILAHQSGPYIEFRLSLLHDRPPATWTVWPHSPETGWQEKHRRAWEAQ